MGKAGRLVCIFTPFLLTLASLVCIALVLLGGTNKSNTTLQKFYFFRANLTGLTSGANVDLIPGTDADNQMLSSALSAAESAANITNFYDIYMWNYCRGPSANNATYCSPRSGNFWFNPVEVWGLDRSGLDNALPSDVRNGLNVYHKVSHWMMVAYVVAFFATLAEIVVSVFAICSRWGSFATTIFSTLSSFFIFAASLTATILFSILTTTFNRALQAYGIHGTLGHSTYVSTWLAVAFSWAAGFFWLLSVCCCSGRSPYHKDADRSRGFGGMMGGNRNSVNAEKAPYTYARVESPYGQQQTGIAPGNNSYSSSPYGYNTVEGGHRHHHHQDSNVPMLNLQRASGDVGMAKKHRSGYEPFRQV